MPQDGHNDTGGWAADRRHRDANEAMAQQRLRALAEQQRELREDIKKLAGEVEKSNRAGDERGFLIRRIDEKIVELFKRLEAVEGKYLPKDEYERQMAPWRRIAWAMLLLLLTTVGGAILAGVIVKGGVPH